MTDVASPSDQVEAIVAKFEKALKEKRSFDTLWDAAYAWKELARHSQEASDLRRALELFRQASRKTVTTSNFYTQFGEALLLFGEKSGDPRPAREALEWLQKAIIEGESSAWVPYAEGHKLLYELSGDREDFEKADSIFQRAIIAQPECGFLWLHWGEMFLQSGWRRRHVPDVEVAIEKFTSLKAEDCPPALVTAYLGEALALLGLFFDDLKLIHDGKEKVVTLLNQHLEFPHLLYAAGMIHLVEGLYFADRGHFISAADYFHKGLEYNSHDLRFCHALYQVYLGWGTTMKDVERIDDACATIERLSKLRPFSSVHLIEWGIALLRLYQGEFDPLEQQAIVEEAILKFRKAIELNGDLEAHYQLGGTLDLLGDITGCEEYYEEAIELLSNLHFRLPQDIQVIFHLALALSHHGELLGNVESLYESIRYFTLITEIDQEDEEAWCHLGYTKLVLSELVYDENHPEISDELRSEAEAMLMHAAKLGNSEANYHLTCLYSLSNLCESAMHYLKRAEVLDALPPLEELDHDHWLSNLRKTAAYRDFMAARRYHG
ncbi:MAG: hypothetical protein H7A36_05075 [Chlamydiales bacterium]|nr:hypothetical protein [Chlamydiales bacterium]